MRTFLKIIGFLAFSITVAFVGVILWIDREQNIDFTNRLPLSFSTCNGLIDEGNFEYDALETWFLNNRNGWRTYLVTTPNGYYYESEEINIIVTETSVLIRYLSEGGWALVGKTTNTDAIRNESRGNS